MGNEHWINTSLDIVVLSKKGKKPAKLESTEFKNSLPYIDIEAFETGKIKQFADIDTSNQCQKKDVLVVWDGARFGLTGTDQIGAIGSTLACLAPILIESSYLHKFIQRHYNTIQQKPKGMATPHVDPEVFWNLEFPLPPLPEQKRIVEKLDTILPKAKSVKSRLDKIPRILKRFRQSVLASACSGKLTEDWREGKDLPDWDETTIGDVIEDLSYGTSQKCDYKVKNGVPVLRIPNVSSGKLDLSDLKYACLDPKEIKKLSLKVGDLLLVRSNGSVSLLGQSVLIEELAIGFAYAGYLIRLRCIKEKLSSKFLNLTLKTSDLRSQIELPARSTTGVHNINSDEIRSLAIPLPSLEEQHEIVRRVEKLFKLADSLEAKYKKALARVEKIEQSVLAKAFRGELAPQDPNDEPAEELLKRILAEKSKLQTPRKKPPHPPRTRR
jgi:type I restriction enzyme, S subunit